MGLGGPLKTMVCVGNGEQKETGKGSGSPTSLLPEMPDVHTARWCWKKYGFGGQHFQSAHYSFQKDLASKRRLQRTGSHPHMQELIKHHASRPASNDWLGRSSAPTGSWTEPACVCVL